MTLKGQKQSMLGCATRMRGAWQQGVLVSFGRITHPCSRPTQLDDRLVGHDLDEDLDGGLRVSVLQRSLGPAIAAVEHGVAGRGEVRGRACIGHADRSSPGV